METVGIQQDEEAVCCGIVMLSRMTWPTHPLPYPDAIITRLAVEQFPESPSSAHLKVNLQSCCQNNWIIDFGCGRVDVPGVNGQTYPRYQGNVVVALDCVVTAVNVSPREPWRHAENPMRNVRLPNRPPVVAAAAKEFTATNDTEAVELVNQVAVLRCNTEAKKGPTPNGCPSLRWAFWSNHRYREAPSVMA